MQRLRKDICLAVILFVLVPAAAQSATLFVDDFNGPLLNPIWQPSLPTAPWRFSADGVASYQGASGYSFQTVDGRTVIRLQNRLDNTQRRGWSTSKEFTPNAPIVYEARFNTLVQSATTGIDELLEIWLLDAGNPSNYDIVALSAPNFGVARVFTSWSSITNTGIDTNFAFENNTWYRLVIRGSRTQNLRGSLYREDGTAELIGVDLGHTLAAYPDGFRLGISQSMGFPDAPFPTDVALDSVRLTTVPPDDADGDGIPDREDACPHSDLSATVAVQGCDTGVTNPLLPSGCTIADLTMSCGEHPDHPGRPRSCIARLANDLKEDRIITHQQEDAIMRCARN
jgi:hypothetical protein